MLRTLLVRVNRQGKGRVSTVSAPFKKYRSVPCVDDLFLNRRRRVVSLYLGSRTRPTLEVQHVHTLSHRE